MQHLSTGANSGLLIFHVANQCFLHCYSVALFKRLISGSVPAERFRTMHKIIVELLDHL